MKRSIGFMLLSFGALELGFVGLVGELLGRPTFLAWCGFWCLAMIAAGARTVWTLPAWLDSRAGHGWHLSAECVECAERRGYQAGLREGLEFACDALDDDEARSSC